VNFFKWVNVFFFKFSSGKFFKGVKSHQSYWFFFVKLFFIKFDVYRKLVIILVTDLVVVQVDDCRSKIFAKLGNRNFCKTCYHC
jgi:hypothetical protein